MNYKLKIKMIRIRRRISQKELAKKIGISGNYLSELESNKFDIRLGLLIKISDVLEVDLKDLYEKID